MSTHDAHTSFIKTPQQLIVVILLSFIVPIIGIVLLVQLVTGRPGADPDALKPEAVAARLQPVAKVEVSGGGGGAAGARSGEEIRRRCAPPAIRRGCERAEDRRQGVVGTTSRRACSTCSPPPSGKGAMPPRGGNASLSDDEVARAIVPMANQSGANFGTRRAQGQTCCCGRRQKSAATGADGKAVYDKTCTVCHAAGVIMRRSPTRPPGSRASTPARTRSTVGDQGKGAMPPKAGNLSPPTPSSAAIDYMVSQSK